MNGVHAIVVDCTQSKRRDKRHEKISIHKCLSVDFSETMDCGNAIVVLGT